MRLLRLLCLALILGTAVIPALVMPTAFAADGDPKENKGKGK